MHKKIIEVVAGILLRPNGDFLLGSRPQGKPYAGYWEFPGGKVESGESFLQALAREFQEEMGIGLLRASYWQTRVHHYEHASVRLRFFLVHEWSGVPRPLEGQSFAWMRPGDNGVGPMLPANGPILKALTLPSRMMLTDARHLGVSGVLDRLNRPDAPSLVLVREPEMDRENLIGFVHQVCESVHAYGGRVLLDANPLWLDGLAVDGLHLSEPRLMDLSQRPEFEWVGASVSDAVSLAHAGNLSLDYALLGPVFSADAPVAAPGWDRVQLIQETAVPMPVFVVGGLHPDDVAVARAHGAHGIALLPDVW
jgi:8-oxo-dGTP diphosphatase